MEPERKRTGATITGREEAEASRSEIFGFDLLSLATPISRAGRNWIPDCPDLNIEFRGGLLRSYSLEEQTELISFASQRLQACGAAKPLAFRAGDYSDRSN